MTDASLSLSPSRRARIGDALRPHRPWLASALILGVLLIADWSQGVESARFTVAALIETTPYLIVSIALAAYAVASGADRIVARAFMGAPALMVLLAAAFGGLSPFCSCGVIPLIAALLAMGVPLSAVMAFWLASPVIDPSMFALTVGVLDLDFAIGKTLAAVALGLFGGYATLAMERAGGFRSPLRPGVGDGGCGGAMARSPQPVHWRFWREADRRATFGREAGSTTAFLAKWLALAFLLESLMIAYAPADLVGSAVGTDGVSSIALATLVGVPAYLNGYAALPLVSGLIEQGMAQGAAMAFLVAGGVTSIPAALAVWALARRPVFIAYIIFALTGSFAVGLAFQLWAA
mgnify:CR=1 FL=1